MKGLIGSAAGVAISLLPSCNRATHEIQPQISYAVQDRYLKALPSPFPPLSPTEKASDWGTEYRIGIGFARQLDLYRAITSFRRAEILAPESAEKRKLEMQYEILLCYYLGKRYEQVDQAFTSSGLSRVDSTFPAYKDLLTILYDTYIQLDEEGRACQILLLIQKLDEITYNKLALSTAMQEANLPILEVLAPTYPYLTDLLSDYCACKKSPTTAAMLNATLPGSGYLYLGQVQTGITALLVNGLFIASSVYFFQNGPIAAGILFASFEAGWYIGGIQGAASQARFYNERLYEQLATFVMNREKLFPIFQLRYAF